MRHPWIVGAVIIKNNIFVPIVVVPARLEQAEWGVRGNRVRIPSSPAAVSFYRRVGFWHADSCRFPNDATVHSPLLEVELNGKARQTEKRWSKPEYLPLRVAYKVWREDLVERSLPGTKRIDLRKYFFYNNVLQWKR